MRVIVAAALLALSLPACAHGLLESVRGERLPILVGALLFGAAWLLYRLGARRVRPHGREALWMHVAMLIAALSAFGPLDDWAETSTSLHMLQHMLFMLAVAPLWALGRPLPQWRAMLGATLQPLWNGILRAARYPVATAMVHGALIWIWHTPRLYLLALEHPGWHMIEHACFLFSAWLFWWSCLHAHPRLVPQALLAMLLTLMHTCLLGALLTFGDTPFYGDARDLQDQQLAGLLMWVPGGLVYLAGAGWIAWRWLGRLWRRQQRVGSSPLGE